MMLGITLLAILTAVVALSEGSSAAKEVIETDWIVNITDPGGIDNEYIMKANLTVTGTGQISFLRCKFKFISETPGQYGITVDPGGYLILQSCLLEAGDVTPGVQADPWTFYVKDSGRLSIQASDVRDLGVVGGSDKQRGLTLETDGAYVVGSTFSDCNRGIVVLSSASPVIDNNTFEDNTVGIEFKGASFSLSRPNEFLANNMGILYSECGNGFLGAGSFGDNTYGVRAVASKVMVEAVTISGMGTAVSSELNSYVHVTNSTLLSFHKQGKALFGSDLHFTNCRFAGFLGSTETDLGSHIVAKNSVHFYVHFARLFYPVEGADVEIHDANPDKVYQQVTGPDGLSPERLVTIFEHHNGEPPVVNAPFKAVASMGYNYEEIVDLAIGPNHVIEVEFVDDEAPVINVMAPADGALYNTTEVECRGRLTDIHSGISRFFYTLDGGAPVNLPIQDPWQVTELLPEGELTLLFVAEDLVGNRAEVTRDITIDTTKPRIIDIDPPDGSITREYSMLVIGLTEPGTTIKVDGEPLDVQPDGSFSGFVTLGDEEGDQVAVFHLEDEAGNKATERYTMVVDRTPPHLDVETDPDHRDFPYVNRSLVVVFGNTEPGARVEVSYNGALANETVGDENGSWRVEIHLVLGENQLLVDAYDEAGNRASVEIIDFYYDVTPPEITILAPENGTIVKVSSIDVKVRTEEGTTIWVNEEDSQVQPAHGEVDFIDVPLYDEGENALVVYVVDRAGNRNTTTLYVIRESGGSNGGTEDEGFPLWAIILIVVAVVVALLVTMQYLRSRS